MIAARNFGFLNPVHTTNYIAAFNAEACSGCEKCVKICPVGAFEQTGNKKQERKVHFSGDHCLGCGVCVRACPSNALRLEARAVRVYTPLNSAHRTVVMAIERGKLQNLIFDNQVLFSHRMLGALLGVILKLPGIQKKMANKQIQSRYLETVVSRLST